MRDLCNLEPDQMDKVIKAVNEWCRVNRTDIESDQGRRAIIVAINLIWSRELNDLHAELHAQLMPRDA